MRRVLFVSVEAVWIPPDQQLSVWIYSLEPLAEVEWISDVPQTTPLDQDIQTAPLDQDVQTAQLNQDIQKVQLEQDIKIPQSGPDSSGELW